MLWAAGTWNDSSSPGPTNRAVIRYVSPVSVLQTLLLYGGGTIGLYLLIVLAVVVPKRSKQPRHRVGKAWGYAPLWWTANPEGAHLPAAAERSAGGERGGARGNW